jgi:dolichyl-phosphate beta-glucosyltransferase
LRSVSIIVPTFRERQLAEQLRELVEHLGTIAHRRFELIVIDDSPDAERDDARVAVRAASSLAPNVTATLHAGARTGKGAAVRLGVLAARGDVVFEIDADLPVPLHHVEDFAARVDAGADIVIAERPVARNVASPVRFALSRALYLLQRAVVFGGGWGSATAFRDTQCGFKAFRRDVARAIAAVQIVDGGMYDIEYLYAARGAGLRVDAVPVVPRPERRRSTIDLRRALLIDARDLARIRAAGARGRYREIARVDRRAGG